MKAKAKTKSVFDRAVAYIDRQHAPGILISRYQAEDAYIAGWRAATRAAAGTAKKRK